MVVDEMNRLGMIIDLTHSSHQTIREVFESSAAPVIFSHSAAYALCNDSRNLPDDILKNLVNCFVVVVRLKMKYLLLI